IECGQVNALHCAAVFDALLATGVLDEDAPHRLRRRREKMAAAIPFLILISGETQPRFMYERRGLQGVTRLLVGHLVRRELAQFAIDKRQQFLRSFGIAMLNRVENASDLAHALEPKRSTAIA